MDGTPQNKKAGTVMGLYTEAGVRRTKAALDTSTVADAEVVIDEDLYLTKPYGKLDTSINGEIKTLFIKAGTVVRQSFIDNIMFPLATVTAKSVTADLATAGGTVITYTGTNLDGCTGVTFGGTAGTSFSILSSTQVRVTTPAKAAGTYDVVFADDAGNVTKTGYATFA